MRIIPNDHAYYLRRERECRERAAEAIDPQIRALHLDFAGRYALQARDERPFDTAVHANDAMMAHQRA